MSGMASRPEVTFAAAALAAPTSGIVVPLTPAALLSCRTTGAPHELIDDIVDRPALFADVESYLRWQLRTVAELDEAISAGGAIVAATQMIKTPLDSLVASARLLDAVVTELRPAAVNYVGPGGIEERDPFHHGHLQYWPLLGDLPLAARLLPLVAKTRSLPFHSTQTARPSELAAPEVNISRDLRWSLRARLGPLRYLDLPGSGVKATGEATLATWSGGYGMAAVARQERARGARMLFLLRGHGHTAVLGPGPLGYRALGPPVSLRTRLETDVCSESANDLLQAIDEWARVPGAGSHFSRRLAVLTGVIVPVIDRVASGLVPQLEKAGVTSLVSANPWSLEEFGALVAARRLGIRRTLFQHGDHAFDYDAWLLTETHNFEAMVCTDPSMVPDLREASKRLGTALPDIAVGNHREPRHVGRRQGLEGEIFYVPSSFMGDTAALPIFSFDDAWYARWQGFLLEMMEGFSHLRFVWKAVSASNQAVDPMPSVMERIGIANVRHETRPFPSLLPHAGRVLMDFPSTALYETVHAGVPVACVTFPRFAALRPNAMQLLEGVLHPCGDEDAALAVLRTFLSTPDRDAAVSVDKARQRLLGLR